MISEDTERAGQYQKIVAIPLKRNPRPVMGYLDIAEVQAILNSIDRDTSTGSRDYALFSLLRPKLHLPYRELQAIAAL